MSVWMQTPAPTQADVAGKADASAVAALTTTVSGKVAKGDLLVAVDDQAGADDDAKIDAALAAVASGGHVRFGQPRTYVVNADHQIPVSKIEVTGAPGAIIQIGSARTGQLATYGRVFRTTGTSRVKFRDLTFVGPVTPWATIPTESAVIYLNGTDRCEVVDCSFDLTGSVTDSDRNGAKLDAVWVRGLGTHNKVRRNTFVGAGVRYSYAGASYTTCSDNESVNAPGNAFTGTGNATPTTVYNVGCRVERNNIFDPLRMGVEDFSRCLKTVIAGNVIERPGTMAISAVSAAAQVERNVIVDPAEYALELPHKGEIVTGNEISYVTVTPTAEAVIVNAGTATAVAGLGRIGTTLVANTIHRAYYAIGLTSATGTSGALRNVTMIGNTITDWISHAVRAVNIGTTEATLTMTGNILRQTTPSTTSRRGIAIGSVVATVSGNQFIYSAAAGGGTAQDVAIHINGPMTLSGNTVDGGGITSPAAVVVSPISNSPTGVSLDATNVFKNSASYTLGTAVDPAATLTGIARQTRTGNGAVTIDPMLGGHHEVTLAGNATSLVVTSTRLAPGAVLTVGFVQDATGGRGVTWPASFKFCGGSPPAASAPSARAAVTVQYDGTNWNELGRYDPAGYPAAGAGVVYTGPGVYSATADAVLANSTTETVLDTYTIAPGALVAGTVLRVRVAATASNVVTSGTLVFRVRMGGLTGTLITGGTAASAAAAGTGVVLRLESQCTIRTAGSSGALAGDGALVGRLGANAVTSIPDARTGTVNTTIANDLVVTAQWATADAGNTLTRLACVMELVKA